MRLIYFSMYLKSLLLILITTSPCYAQVASSSFFGSMKSINPAVINYRPHGYLSLKGGKEKVEKYQSIDTSVNLEGRTDIAVDTYSAFYGGKGGGLLTSELSFFSSSGDRTMKVTETGATPVSISNDISFSQAKAALGFFRYLGFSFVKQSYEFHEKFEFTFDGNDFFEDEKVDISETIISFGAAFPLGSFSFGTFYEKSSQTKDTKEFVIPDGWSEKSEKLSAGLVGFGAGYASKAMHIEISYEKKLSSDQGDKGANRLSGTVELKWNKITVGYTGQLYRDGFKDSNSLVFNQLVYPDSGGDDRLVNTFNLSFSPPKGLSIGGSISKTKSTEQEVNPLVSSTYGKVNTEVETLAYSINLGYSF